MDDFAILKRASELENDPRDRRAPGLKNWQFHQVGASRSDIQRLIDEGLIIIAVKSDDRYAPKTLYKLTQKGKDIIWTANMEAEMERIPASAVMDAMDLIIGFDDLKQRIARAIETRRKVNFLLEGPPASVHADTEVWVDLGDGPKCVPISTLKGKDFKSLSVHPITQLSGWYEAKLSEHQYTGEWVEITGVGVLPFNVTATHSLVAYDPVIGCLIPKRAREIRVGDLLPVNSKWSSQWVIPPNGNKVFINNCPIELTRELGFVIGFWLGDGGLSQGNTKMVTFTNHNTAVLERIRRFTSTLPSPGRHSLGGHLSSTSLNVQNGYLFQFLKDNFIYGDGRPGIKGRTSRWKCLPPWVMQGPIIFIQELLNGYFYADGSVYNGVITATTTSPRLARDITMLLTRLGIVPGLQHRGRDAQAIVIRQCDAKLFLEAVGVFRENKHVSTSVLLHDESFKVPFPFGPKTAQSFCSAIRKGRSSQSFTRRAAQELFLPELITKMRTLLEADIRWVRVERVLCHDEPEQTVYDLSVPGAETFVLGNRVLVHNCGKSLILDAVRAVVQKSYMAFGSRTSGAGLSNILFEVQPTILLMDEADKMNGECYSVLLGLMESGEIIETKSRKTRGIKLDTMVIAACNSSFKFTPEFLSRFGLHAHFPHYTRDEFIDVCHGFLTKKENCPDDIARMIGARIYDYDIGDVRKARGCWQLMDEATEEQVEATVQLMLKYGPNMDMTPRRKKISKNQATLL